MLNSNSLVRPASLPRTRPTRACCSTNSGISGPQPASLPGQQDHPTGAARTATTLPVMELAVVLSTDCTPPMSLTSRDWSAPVRVTVKRQIQPLQVRKQPPAQIGHHLVAQQPV
jgi:hypothetical protein